MCYEFEWGEGATEAIDLARTDVEAMVHAVPVLPTLHDDGVVGSVTRCSTAL